VSLIVEAILALEGTAIVRSNLGLILVRPPYKAADCPLLRESALPEAVLKYGFASLGEHFDTWDALIRYLNTALVDARAKQGLPLSVSDEELIEAMPLELVVGFLDQVESQLIPSGILDQAERVLLAILGSGLSELSLMNRAGKLLNCLKHVQVRLRDGTMALEGVDARFESLEQNQELENSARIARIVRERGCIFAACA
jgi:hypothetical protein